MKCRCPKCRTVILVDKSQLKDLRTPCFKCPDCNCPVKIPSKRAKCGKCSTPFRYYEFKFDKNKPYVKCPNCRVVNRLQIRN